MIMCVQQQGCQLSDRAEAASQPYPLTPSGLDQLVCVGVAYKSANYKCDHCDVPGDDSGARTTIFCLLISVFVYVSFLLGKKTSSYTVTWTYQQWCAQETETYLSTFDIFVWPQLGQLFVRHMHVCGPAHSMGLKVANSGEWVCNGLTSISRIRIADTIGDAKFQ